MNISFINEVNILVLITWSMYNPPPQKKVKFKETMLIIEPH